MLIQKRLMKYKTAHISQAEITETNSIIYINFSLFISICLSFVPSDLINRVCCCFNVCHIQFSLATDNFHSAVVLYSTH